MSYEQFLSSKLTQFTPSGFDVPDRLLNPNLFPFQRDIVKLALKLGKFCDWADTGLGKGLQLLSIADALVQHENIRVIILAPLGVAKQLQREAQKFSIQSPIAYCLDNAEVSDGITITNYERLHRFDVSQFGGVLLDEASLLKASDGKTCQYVIDSFRSTPYKFAFSATPAPNDQMELGTQCEFLGVMSKSEMLAMYFTHDGGDTSKWRLKGHAQSKFWEFVATWAVMLRSPSDLGYDDDGYNLPPLNINELVVSTDIAASNEGELFAWEARSLSEQRTLNRMTLSDRVAVTAELVNGSSEQFVVWCETNEESALLTKTIDDAVEVKGADSLEHKERSMLDFVDGKIRVLVSKPSICGFGMNFQNCHNCVFVSPQILNSFESVYQAVRRFYRFGQQSEVNVWFVRHRLNEAAKRNYERKTQDADRLYKGMMAAMQQVTLAQLQGIQPDRMGYQSLEITIPDWLVSIQDSALEVRSR